MADEMDGMRAAAEGAEAVHEHALREEKMWHLMCADKEADTTLTLAIAGRHFAITKLVEAVTSVFLGLTSVLIIGMFTYGVYQLVEVFR